MKEFNKQELNKTFTRSFIKEFLLDSFNITNQYREHIINKIEDSYELLKYSYRNEYFYKNVIMFKCIFKSKLIYDKRIAFNEFQINLSKADLVILGKDPIVYEIKTEFDNFERLIYQLDDYYKAFPYCYVVTNEQNFYPLYKLLKDTSTGILVINNDGGMSRKYFKSSNADYSKLDKEVIFKLLHKTEYEKIITEFYGSLPKVSKFEYYNSCKILFNKISLNIIYPQILFILKMRKKNSYDILRFIPIPIRTLIYFMDLNKDQIERLSNIFVRGN